MPADYRPLNKLYLAPTSLFLISSCAICALAAVNAKPSREGYNKRLNEVTVLAGHLRQHLHLDPRIHRRRVIHPLRRLLEVFRLGLGNIDKRLRIQVHQREP